MSNLLIVSTAHLTDATNAFLASTDYMNWPILGGPYRDVGWFFRVDEDAHPDPEEPFSDLYQVIQHAADLGYGNVLFYDLGEAVEDLPTFRDPDSESLNATLYRGSAWGHSTRDQANADQTTIPLDATLARAGYTEHPETTMRLSKDRAWPLTLGGTGIAEPRGEARSARFAVTMRPPELRAS